MTRLPPVLAWPPARSALDVDRAFGRTDLRCPCPDASTPPVAMSSGKRSPRSTRRPPRQAGGLVLEHLGKTARVPDGLRRSGFPLEAFASLCVLCALRKFRTEGHKDPPYGRRAGGYP